MNRHLGSRRILSFMGLGVFVLCNWLSQIRGVGESQILSTSHHTPTPILTPAFFQRNDDLIPLFETLLNTEDCILPCWWALQPGVSSAEDIRVLLEETGLDRNLDGPFRLDSTDAPIGQEIQFNFVDISTLSHVSFYVDEMRLRWIYIWLWFPGRWLSEESNRLEIPSLLSEMDELPEVYIFTDTGHQILLNNIGLTLLYPESGVMVWYSFDILEDQPQPSNWPRLRICPSMERTNYVQMWLQSPDDEEPVSRFIRGLMGSENYHPIEEILDIDAETFVEFFFDNPDECLETTYIGRR